MGESMGGRQEEGKGERGVADLHNLLCSNGPNNRLHGTGITAALVGKPGHESLIQLLNLRENKRPIRSQITYKGALHCSSHAGCHSNTESHQSH